MADNNYIDGQKHATLRHTKVSPIRYGFWVGVFAGSLSSLPLGLIPPNYLSTDSRLWIMLGIGLLVGGMAWGRDRKQDATSPNLCEKCEESKK